MLYIGYHLSSVNGFEAMGREALAAGAKKSIQMMQRL